MIPRDFPRFGHAEMEGPLRTILHADDQWAYIPIAEGVEWDLPHVESEEEEEAAAGALIRQSSLRGNRAAFVRGIMMGDQGTCSYGARRNRVNF